MYLSKIIKTKNKMYIYDALNNDFETISSIDEIEDKSKYKYFLRRTDFRDIKKSCSFKIKYPFSDIELTNMYKNSVNSITLVLTENCNLRCKYCGYMPKYTNQNYKLKDMSKTVAIKSIDFIMNSSNESETCHIGFYGGEPLIKIDLIKECIDYINSKYPFRRPTYNIVTNAVLLDKNIAEFLMENNFKIIISLDGPTQEFNKYRVLPNDECSFEKAFKNIKNLYYMDPKYFRENVTYNVVMYNGPSNELFEVMDNLWKSGVNMIELFKTDYFVEHRENDGINSQNGSINVKEYKFAYDNMLKTMKKYYNAFYNSSGGNLIFPGGFCIPGVRKNFITPEGKILVCEKVDESKSVYEIGNIEVGIEIDKVNNLIRETMNSLEKCKYCWAARFCRVCFKDIININEEFCKQSKIDIERELSYYLEYVNNNRELLNHISNISLI
ncbi:TPA: lachnocin radical SAM maturase [Streptococcus agalactiae]